jgi:peptidyl-prolyl cis-trans isomerase B (cyclophilin B)
VRGLALALVVVAAGCGGGGGAETAVSDREECEQVEPPEQQRKTTSQKPTEPLDGTRTYRLVLATSCGEFTIELDPEAAPNASASLVQLARSGYFDGTTFHRVVPGFVIQGGDPTGTGSGGPGYSTVDPPPATAAYTEGVVAMAKTPSDPAGTAGSQFFVVTAQDAGLPRDYAVVGRVTQGLDAVRRIEALGDRQTERPRQPVVIERVTVEMS